MWRSRTLSHRESPLQLDVQHTRAHHDLIRALRLHPLLRGSVPLADVLLPQIERHRLAVARRKRGLGKASQHPRIRARNLKVELRDLCRGDTAYVCHPDGDGTDCVEQTAAAVEARLDAEFSVREIGVRQTVAEFVARRDVAVQEGAVVDVDALGEVAYDMLASRARVVVILVTHN